MENNDVMHVTLAVWDPSGTYSRHAGATIASILNNTQRQVLFHILHDDTLTPDNREKLQQTACSLGSEMLFYNVAAEIEKHSSSDIAKMAGSFTLGTLFRIFLSNMVAVDKIIYLDCDIVVNIDIKKLWNVDISNNYIAAVEDFLLEEKVKNKSCFSHTRFCMKKLGLFPLKDYFNAGVALLNLKLIRETVDMTKAFADFSTKYNGCTAFSDQDFLNIIFKDKKKLIDPHFNIPANYSKDITPQTEGIFHFSGMKPWDIHLNIPVEKLYWQSVQSSAWGDNLIEYMLKARGERYLHLRSSDCYHTLLNKFKKNFCTESSLSKIISATLTHLK